VDLRATNSSLKSGVYANTNLTNCILEGDISIKPGGNMSGTGIVFEGDLTTIDMLNQPSTVSLDVDSGYFKLKNAIVGSLAEFNLRGGEIEIDTTCTGGEYYLEGYGTLYNNGTMTEKGNHLLALETIPINVWSNQNAIDQTTKIDELHKVGGLDPENPATTTLYDIKVGGINIDITGDGETSTTLTRND
jgi:hypothetical protein